MCETGLTANVTLVVLPTYPSGPRRSSTKLPGARIVEIDSAVRHLMKDRLVEGDSIMAPGRV